MIDKERFGVSFSIKQCRNFQIDPADALDWLIEEAGFRRFRLMSYWNEHEKQPGKFDFSALDAQIERVAKAKGVITLCLGNRQPRYPENHWPDWAWEAPKDQRTAALLNYVATVVERYKDNPAIISYQLENEALLTYFGERNEVDHKRLRDEFALVKRLDPSRPVIMSTSSAIGIPIRRPIPDIVGFSIYKITYKYKKKKYETSPHFAFYDRLRALLIRIIWRRPSFIHELQLEPWGPTEIWKMTPEQQDESMGPKQIAINVKLGKDTRLYPIDLWGGEWYYWRTTKLNDPSTWQAVKANLKDPA
jgi:hypothetical protein